MKLRIIIRLNVDIVLIREKRFNNNKGSPRLFTKNIRYILKRGEFSLVIHVIQEGYY